MPPRWLSPALALGLSAPHAEAFDGFRMMLPNLGRPRTCPAGTPELSTGKECFAPFALGHVADLGGGELNAFGKMFYAEGKSWTRKLCKADSDDDGFTNGQELGDPCCCWAFGAEPDRTSSISHPGDPHSTPFHPNEARIPDHCECAAVPEEGKFLQHLWAWANDFSAPSMMKKAFTAAVGGFTYYMFKLGVVDVIKSKGPVWAVGMLLVTMLYMDMTSGFVHLVLDNPANLANPILADGTQSFLNHHADPQLIVRLELPKYFCAHHSIVFAIFALNFPKMASSPTIRVFGVFSLAWSQVMQMAHRWSHAPAALLPVAVQWAQASGLIIDQKYHARHHTPPHDKSFCIMMGWTDHFINYATEYLIDCKNTWWNLVLLAWLFVPVACVTLGTMHASRASPASSSSADLVKELASAESSEGGGSAASPAEAEAGATGGHMDYGEEKEEDDGADEGSALLAAFAGVPVSVGGGAPGGGGVDAEAEAALAAGGVRLVRRLAWGAAACLCAGSVLSYGGLAAEAGVWPLWLHPVLMSLGTVWLMTEGLAHRFLPGFRDGGALPAAESAGAEDSAAVASALPGLALSKEAAHHAARTAPHKRAQQAAGALVCLGFAHAVGLKWRAGLSAVPNSPHAIVGFASVCGVAVQVAVGLAKHARLVPTGAQSAAGAVPERAHKWHGQLGWFVYGSCLVSAVLGVAQSRALSVFSYLGVYGTASVGVAVFALKERSDARNAAKARKATQAGGGETAGSKAKDKAQAARHGSTLAGGGGGKLQQRKGHHGGDGTNLD